MQRGVILVGVDKRMNKLGGYENILSYVFYSCYSYGAGTGFSSCKAMLDLKDVMFLSFRM